MILRSLYLQHFRNYSNTKFDFSEEFTVIIGPNTAGKTNLSEAIHLLLTGKSFRTSSDMDMVAFGQDIARVQGLLVDWIPDQVRDDKCKVEVMIASATATGGRFSKKFLLNGVAKSKAAVIGTLPLVLFRPEELEIITDGPALRRDFLDSVLEQTDKEYQQAKHTYDRSLRQRNALLRLAQETPLRQGYEGQAGRLKGQFEYWDNLLIENGQLLTDKRKNFLDFINEAEHTIFPLKTQYDTSTISRERLDQYKDAEVGAGVTLVGPHRDDFVVEIQVEKQERNVQHFGSRGQQRLAVLQLKMLQIQYIQDATGKKPLLVLDDIFSELDSRHIQLVLDNVQASQGILTTTHKEFIPEAILKNSAIIELNK